MRQITAAVFALLFALSPAYAQRVWKTDLSHSQVKFSVTHLVIAEVTGKFNDFEVTLTQTGKDDFAGSSIEATVKMASIDTDNETRDNHLRSDDFFNAEKYPVMSFKSTKIEKTGEKMYKITCTLTIRDVTRTVVLDTRYMGEVKDPRGTMKSGFKATTSINRFDYGVKWDKKIEGGGLVVGETVDITLLMEFALQDAKQ
ncbi:MAG TPA: YceI family protein [Bacteroidota bacterium]|nr:YceI family protein [Bacteroidota bacterium]